jgi:hypothetical protein
MLTFGAVRAAFLNEISESKVLRECRDAFGGAHGLWPDTAARTAILLPRSVRVAGLRSGFAPAPIDAMSMAPSQSCGRWVAALNTGARLRYIFRPELKWGGNPNRSGLSEV